jgi:hypothetical protein
MDKWNTRIPHNERTGENHTVKECSRILTAAVINPQFCRILLTNPGKALAMGFAGEPFQLNPESHTLLSGIHAQSLPEFARQLNGALPKVFTTA